MRMPYSPYESTGGSVITTGPRVLPLIQTNLAEQPWNGHLVTPSQSLFWSGLLFSLGFGREPNRMDACAVGHLALSFRRLFWDRELFPPVFVTTRQPNSNCSPSHQIGQSYVFLDTPTTCSISLPCSFVIAVLGMAGED